jgi:hypothetical protein
VTRPQTGTGGQLDGCEQMGIDKPDADAEKRSAIDEVEDLVIRRDGGLGQLSQSAQHEITFAQITESELAGHKTMPEDFPVGEELAEHTIAGSQVVDPDRGIYQDHS